VSDLRSGECGMEGVRKRPEVFIHRAELLQLGVRVDRHLPYRIHPVQTRVPTTRLLTRSSVAACC
jgi:hypothetical protein